jgi:hypothetical protein
MKCVRELRQLIEELPKRGGLSQDDVNSILLRIRQLFEIDRRAKNQFPLLNLFCNWVVHTSLRDSVTIYRFLVDISKSISSAIHLSNGEDARERTTQFIHHAGNLLQIPRLRSEIREILQQQGIVIYLTDRKEWWDAFVTLLLREISEKPLEFPAEVVDGTKESKKASKFFSELKALPHIYDWDKVIRLVVFEKEGKYHIRLESLGRVQYVVKLLGKEGNGAFALNTPFVRTDYDGS